MENAVLIQKCPIDGYNLMLLYIYIYMIYMPFASQNLLCWPHFEKSGGSHMTEKWHQLDGNMVK